MITFAIEISNSSGVSIENPTPFLLGSSKLGEGDTFGKSYSPKIEINVSNILELQTSIKDRDEIDFPSFGLISNGGRLSFKDYNSEFITHIKNGNLGHNDQVKIYLENTITKNREQIGRYYISQINYDPDLKEIELQLTDGMEALQDVDFAGINPYKWGMNDTNIGISTTLNDIFSEIVAYSSNVFDVSFGMDEKTSTITREFKIQVPIMEKCSVWSAFQKASIPSQTHIFTNKNGVISISNNGGN